MSLGFRNIILVQNSAILAYPKKLSDQLIGYVQQRCSFSFVKRKMRSSDSETLLTAAEA